MFHQFVLIFRIWTTVELSETYLHWNKTSLTEPILNSQVATDEVMETEALPDPVAVIWKPSHQPSSLFPVRILCCPVMFLQTMKYPVRNDGGRLRSLLIKSGQNGYDNICQFWLLESSSGIRAMSRLEIYFWLLTRRPKGGIGSLLSFRFEPYIAVPVSRSCRTLPLFALL